jgi:hypothetical protein
VARKLRAQAIYQILLLCLDVNLLVTWLAWVRLPMSCTPSLSISICRNRNITRRKIIIIRARAVMLVLIATIIRRKITIILARVAM